MVSCTAPEVEGPVSSVVSRGAVSSAIPNNNNHWMSRCSMKLLGTGRTFAPGLCATSEMSK